MHIISSLAMAPASANEPSGSWDSIHVFETSERGRQSHYKLTSTVMLQLTTRRSADSEMDIQSAVAFGEKRGAGLNEGWKREGEITLSGSMTRQVSCVAVALLAQVGLEEPR
jgi:capping protein beta